MKAGIVTFLILFYLSLLPSGAQQLWLLRLQDKGLSFSAPEAFLGPDCLQRRKLRGIVTDQSDIPVNPDYVKQVSQHAQILASSKWLNVLLIQTPDTEILKLKLLPFVKSIQLAPSSKSQLAGLSGGSYASNSNWQNKLLQIEQLHLLGLTGKGMRIAVFDVGFSNADINQGFNRLNADKRILHHRNFVRESLSVFRTGTTGEHGARVLSVIAGIQTPWLIGTGFDASFILAATEDLDREGVMEEFNWLNAAEWADSIGTDIISSSLGYSHGFTYGEDYRKEQLDGKTTLVSQAALMAARKGILVVNSAGNEGQTAWKYIISPADADSILAVASVDVYGKYSDFSSPGPRAGDNAIKPDLSAVGANCMTMMADGSLKTGNGTSFACPMISGLAACLWQANPALTAQEIRQAILNSGSLVQYPNPWMGYGIPAALKALETITGNPVEPSLVQDNLMAIYPNPAREEFSIQYFNYLQPRTAILEVFRSTGEEISAWKIELAEGFNRFMLRATDLGLEPGIYLIRLKSDMGSQLSQKKLLLLP